MDEDKCYLIPISEQDKANEYFNNLYNDIIDPNAMDIEGGGDNKRPLDDTDSSDSPTMKKKLTELEKLLTEMGFEETIRQKQDEIRRSPRLQGLKPPNTGLSGGAGTTDDEKKKAIENTQMLTFGIISAIIIGSLASPEQANAISAQAMESAGITWGFLKGVFGDSWDVVSEQISNFGDAYWKQSGNPTLCTTGMDTALDTAMKFPLISGYIGGDGYWKSCAARLAERDDRAMALWALAQKTFVNTATVVGAGTFISRYGSTFAREDGGMRGVISDAKNDLKSLFILTKDLVKDAASTVLISPFTITAGFVTDFFTGGMLISKKIITGTGVLVTNYNNKSVPVPIEQLMSVPPELVPKPIVTEVDKGPEDTSGTGMGGGKRTKRKRTKSKSKRRGKSKKNRRKKSYKKRNKKH